MARRDFIHKAFFERKVPPRDGARAAPFAARYLLPEPHGKRIHGERQIVQFLLQNIAQPMTDVPNKTKLAMAGGVSRRKGRSRSEQIAFAVQLLKNFITLREARSGNQLNGGLGLKLGKFDVCIA
jgi:hypothetical protein